MYLLLSKVGSVRKNYKESPEKKYSGFKSRPTLPKGVIDNNPFQKIIEMFGYQINAKTQDKLYQDFTGKLDTCTRILEDSMQGPTLIRIFQQLKHYFSKIFSTMLKIAQKQTNLYYEQLATICLQYQNKIKQTQKSIKQNIKTKLLNGQSQMGKQIKQIKNRANFNTNIHNQMEMSNIDLMRWVKESQTMDNYINFCQFRYQNQDQGQNQNQDQQSVDSLNKTQNHTQQQQKQPKTKIQQTKIQPKTQTLKNSKKLQNDRNKPYNDEFQIQNIQEQFNEQIQIPVANFEKKEPKLNKTIQRQKNVYRELQRSKTNKSN